MRASVVTDMTGKILEVASLDWIATEKMPDMTAGVKMEGFVARYYIIVCHFCILYIFECESSSNHS